MSTRSLAAEISGFVNTDVAAEPPSAINSASSHLARRPGESDPESNLSTARGLPDPAICQAEALGLAGYAACLVERPFRCPHALGFGWGSFCRHPQRHEIVARTATRDQ